MSKRENNLLGIKLVRLIFLRGLGIIYMIAFFIAFQQNGALIGPTGLTPAINMINRQYESTKSSSLDLFWGNPTLFYFFSPTDFMLNSIALLGLVMSMYLSFSGTGNGIVLFVLWCLYMSIVNVGQSWYGFGWESQLLETGFLAIFTRPIFSTERFPRDESSTLLRVCAWGYRWLLFRIMIGAGLIKIRGDSCWTAVSDNCMNYHYETQPVPSPLSFIFHAAPSWWHAIETMANHIVELVLPWLTFFPRELRAVNGIAQLLFQATLIVSGNLSFLNWLTCLPAIWAFDDDAVSWLFSEEVCMQARAHDSEKERLAPRSHRASRNYRSFRAMEHVIAILLTCLLVNESRPVVTNLFSRRQTMNTSFSVWRVVNTYGAFGSITRDRNEVILQATSSPRTTQLPFDEEAVDWVMLILALVLFKITASRGHHGHNHLHRYCTSYNDLSCTL